jgi:endoglucanase
VGGSGAASGSGGAAGATVTGGGGQGGGGGGPLEGWLYTEGNRLNTSDGQPFRGRGANIHDTRSCWACSWSAPNTGEVERRIDELVDVWGASFVRLLLESYADDQGGAVQWQNVIDDPGYLQDVVEIVDYIGQKPGMYVLMSLWADGSFSAQGWPTATTIAEWELLAETFRNDGHVLFGIVEGPLGNVDGSLDSACWDAMNDTVAAIRAVEDGYGTPHHVIAVQGTRDKGRRLDYYVDHPITAGGGENIVYETHVYDPPTAFQTLFIGPSQTLPVIIGEFGPVAGSMTLADCEDLMVQARANDIPHLGYTFHMRCGPNMLVDYSAAGCGEGMTLDPTEWGTVLQTHLATPW